MCRLPEIRAKAWTTTSADAVPFLEASFHTSPPTVLDVVSENLLLMGYLVGVFSVSSLEALLGIPVPQLLLAVWSWWCPKLCYLVSPDKSSCFSSVVCKLLVELLIGVVSTKLELVVV